MPARRSLERSHDVGHVVGCHEREILGRMRRVDQPNQARPPLPDDDPHASILAVGADSVGGSGHHGGMDRTEARRWSR